MQYASSARSRYGASRSASLYTATASMPRSRQARITRKAISPRLATRIRWNMRPGGQRSEVRGQKSEVRGQMSEVGVRNQTSEEERRVCDSDFRLLTSGF